MRKRVLIVDNYDSFVHNIARMIEEQGACAHVVRNDRIGIDEIAAGGYTQIIISPGPGSPADAGVSNDVVRAFAGVIPILGVCLGHQCIAQVYGASVHVSGAPAHAQVSRVDHHRSGIFRWIPSPTNVTRYHSLVVDPRTLPEELVVTGWSDDGCVMAIEDESRSVVGLQFHPEALLTEHGDMYIANFLELSARPMRSAFLALGSNIGDRPSNILRAVESLRRASGIFVCRQADCIETRAVGPIEQDDFVNTVVEIRTSLSPIELLRCVKRIERDLGRTETWRWGPRVIDIDIVIYDDVRLVSDELEIPHPEMHRRDFVLRPLAQIAPNQLVAGHEKTVTALLEAL